MQRTIGHIGWPDKAPWKKGKTVNMVDYSRFDKICDDLNDDDDDDKKQLPSEPTITAAAPPPVQKTAKGKDNRYKFEYEGRLIYEWEQSLEEVNIYLQPPPGATKADFDIIISYRHLKIGIKNLPPFIDEDTGGGVKVDESYWMLNDGELNINLQKMSTGETWLCALQGRGGQTVDDFTKEEVKKQMMLERFQYEHPGFDFSGAEFNGTVPDAKDFMGGIKHR